MSSPGGYSSDRPMTRPWTVGSLRALRQLSKAASWALLTAVGVALWLANYKLLPETLHVSQRQAFNVRNLMRGYWQLGSSPRFLLLALASGIPFNGMFLYVLAAPAFLGDHLGLAPTQFFWFFMLTISGIMGGSFASGRLAGRIQPKQQIRYGFLVMVLVSVLNVIANLLWPPHVGWALIPALHDEQVDAGLHERGSKGARVLRTHAHRGGDALVTHLCDRGGQQVGLQRGRMQLLQVPDRGTGVRIGVGDLGEPGDHRVDVGVTTPQALTVDDTEASGLTQLHRERRRHQGVGGVREDGNVEAVRIELPRRRHLLRRTRPPGRNDIDVVQFVGAASRAAHADFNEVAHARPFLLY